MNKVMVLLALLALLTFPAMAQDASSPAPAQDKSAPEANPQEKPENKKPAKKDWGPETPRYDITGAYSLLSYYPPTSPRIKMNGFDASLDYNLFRRWLAVAIDVSGNFKNSVITTTTQPVTVNKFSTSVYTFMAGPRIYPFGHAHKLILYGEALFGGGYTRVFHPASAGFGSFTQSDTAPAFGGGGGIDYRLSRHWEIRIIEGDFEETRFFSSAGANVSQSNYRISVGMTYRLGEKK